MTLVSWALDGVIALLLLGLVARIVFTRDLFEAVVLFIAFGLTLALAWVRLGAPDLALAEAALGAGVTGALLLNAYRRLADRVERVDGEGEGGVRGTPTGWIRGLRWVVGGGVALLAAGFATLLLALPGRDPTLPALVAERLDESGVSNPVTGVLLNFRAWDTLLEVGVLVVAMVAVWSMDRGSREFARPEGEAPGTDPVLEALARLAVPTAGVTAIYLVWAGTTASGGAFQGGALLAGAGVLLAAAGILRPVTAATPLVRALGVMGLGLFLVVGLASMGWTGAFLAYPEGTAYGLILLVEGVLAVSIAVILIELFVDVPAVPEADPSLERIDPTGDPLGRAMGLDRIRDREAGDGR
jgi:multisubunit Na+/H+ antiporter MnhB subunit